MSRQLRPPSRGKPRKPRFDSTLCLCRGRSGPENPASVPGAGRLCRDGRQARVRSGADRRTRRLPRGLHLVDGSGEFIPKMRVFEPVSPPVQDRFHGQDPRPGADSLPYKAPDVPWFTSNPMERRHENDPAGRLLPASGFGTRRPIRWGVVYHANYLNYFEVGRTEAMRELGYPYAEMESQGFWLAVCGNALHVPRRGPVRRRAPGGVPRRNNQSAPGAVSFPGGSRCGRGDGGRRVGGPGLPGFGSAPLPPARGCAPAPGDGRRASQLNARPRFTVFDLYRGRPTCVTTPPRYGWPGFPAVKPGTGR